MADKKAYKYPLIPKEYFPAVMFAAKMIREGTYPGKAVRIAANYYNVDEDTVNYHLSRRGGAGSKGKKKSSHTYVVYYDHRGGPFDIMSKTKFEKTYRGYNEDLHKIIVATGGLQEMKARCEQMNAEHGGYN